MNEKLAQALDYISDTHISEAAAAKKKRHRLWLGAAAAVLALVLLLNGPGIPLSVYAKTISEASGSHLPDRSTSNSYFAQREQQWAYAKAARSNLSSFYRESTERYISGAGEENRVWSPVNAYIALAMLAEVTDGESRQQILTALNTSSLETLRTQAGAVWEQVYQDDGHEICTLANSLWLNNSLSYDQATMDNLAYYHHASVYQTDFSSASAGKALQTWLNNNTGGMLKNYTGSSNLDPETVLSLASTIYFQAKWTSEFSAANNTQGLFHSPGGDITCTFMNKKETQTNYYWGESYGAVALTMKNDASMWLILPDEDKTVDDVLAEGEYLDRIVVGTEEVENSKYVKVNLSLPKFDISSGGNIQDLFMELGITDIFDIYASDFTAITSDSPVVVSAVNQAARVMIDEQGVKAATYIEIPGCGAAAPPDEIIDFILDRPFLFVIADYNGNPLFVGVVNTP